MRYLLVKAWRGDLLLQGREYPENPQTMWLKKPRVWVRHDGMSVLEPAKGRMDVVDWYLRLPFRHAALPWRQWRGRWPL